MIFKNQVVIKKKVIMQFEKNFQEFIDKQVEDAAELVFKNAHGYAMTNSGDITPEQQAKLDGIKKDLKQLVKTQVIQNLDEKQRTYYGIPQEPTQEERELAVHKRHCNQGEYEGSCKYGEADCPIVNGVVEKDGLPEVQWSVPVCRTAYAHHTMEVTARTEEEAIEKALDVAGDIEFSEKDADYSAPDGASKL